MAKERPSWHDLGLNRLALSCLGAQAVLLGITAIVYRAHGLSVILDHQAIVKASLPGICFLIWMSFVVRPGPRRVWITAEATFAIFLMNAITWIVAPGQYAALAMGQPFIDETLARADAAIGINVSHLLAWAQQQPRLLNLLDWAYRTLGLQLLLAIPILRLLRERKSMWELVFHFHFCLVVTLVASAFWPVAGPYQWFSYTTPLDLTRVITQVNGFHDGSLTEVRWAELDGLISNPSFHTAAGLFLIWAARRRWWLLGPILIIDGLLILATFLTGIHYLMDTIAGGLLFAVSMFAYKKSEHHYHLLDQKPRITVAHIEAPASILIDGGEQPTAAASSGVET